MTARAHDELVVLLDEDERPIGTAPKATVHHTDTPLHLAFSCYVFDDEGRVLTTRRALDKITWPGVWTNACCGHPGPDESLEDAIHRRLEQELGLAVDDLTCILPRFRYRATAADGTVENEVCPVFCARAVSGLEPDPSEVMDWSWVSWADMQTAATVPWLISPWSAEQIPQLARTGMARWVHAAN
ncbi:isopentenyl-diphosphate Delta-isomerase [Rhodococcus sp. HNM0563]|uniref:isopentenyl-diphosphate Delta-isomerase n=1 Tax=unclassified Rhodococcus (in: high G+C Gram-positive bacteria) TaxID=192944 RepID=UPI00146CC3C3|nr:MULTISPECIES: isopentenyl-diphosphate Delta-isomerase [unclassified Rhodococcus (in: high G+C Gram-positive bacteria)]MCK0093851.1 isopentenyl-diphosphate Delta-isomerase [Rhodococcus sp. F64268]NLU65605.1 isopentenyl-diphosphate Delta-isomerase [Rhodococcus sp. HNM0563]